MSTKILVTGDIGSPGSPLVPLLLTKGYEAIALNNYHVPDFSIHSAPIGEEPDRRGYPVSNGKIEGLGWKPGHPLDDGIVELLKGYKILKPNRFANV